jgi:IS5 family transposase
MDRKTWQYRTEFIMQPRRRDASQLDLFQAQFTQILNLNHSLVLLANKIDWSRFDAVFLDCYSPDMGAPAKAIRLMVGLHYLKHTFNVSDEAVIEQWIENPYWQYFCGFATMQHEPPLHPTSLVKWRQRVGEEKLTLLLQETLAVAVKDQHITQRELAHVNVDTTVQEKNITHPTDSKLYHRAINKLVKAARERGVKLRQSYQRVAKHLAIQVSRYAHAKQFKRMRKVLNQLHTRLGRVIRDVRRKVPSPDDVLTKLLQLCERLHAQKPTDTKKLYSLHEPETQCISKGKAHKRYEFGQKVSITTTNRGDWVVSAVLCENNPYDGHTLAKAIQSTETNTGVAVAAAYVDKGYRGHDYQGDATIHFAGSSNRNLTRTLIQRKRRRSAVEPKIGHLKQDHRMNRCFLTGLVGDAINAVLAAAGCNLRKLLKLLAAVGPALIFWLRSILTKEKANTTSGISALAHRKPPPLLTA